MKCLKELFISSESLSRGKAAGEDSEEWIEVKKLVLKFSESSEE
jgi:hypothetical protein